MKLSKLKLNPDNPQKFNDLTELENGLKKYPNMLRLRPMVYDPETMYVLGGNKRLVCLLKLGYKEIPDEWAKSSEGLTKEELEYFVIADNIGFGQWDKKKLAEKWGNKKVIAWGINNKGKVITDPKELKEGAVEFSEFLNESNNYVVLVFDNDLDWLQAQTHFELKTVASKRSNGKAWSKGIGRVINGGKYLKSINDKIQK